MKRIPILFLFLLIFTNSCKNQESKSVEELQTLDTERTPKEDIKTLERISELAKSDSLSEYFEEAQISSGTQSINEGMDKVKRIWLFRNSKNEIHIDFNPKDSNRIYRITAIGKKNKFYSETGVKPGMTVEELNSLNNKPIDFYGFEWDYSGAVKFNNGKLENKNLFVYLSTDQKYDDKFVGDRIHSFEEAEVADLDLYIDKIIFQPNPSNNP